LLRRPAFFVPSNDDANGERTVQSHGREPAGVVEGAQCLKPLDVFVIAGGLGTRIGAVLGDTPKLLAPIGGKPYLAYLLDWLRNFGARRIVLGLGHRAQAVLDFLERNAKANADLDIATVVEPRPLGTAGAIRLARPQLHSNPVLVMNGDSFAGADLCAFVDRHRQSGAKATLLCVEVDDAGRYGRVDLDNNGRIRGFIEKDPDFHGASAISAGVYLFSAGFLDEIAAGAGASLERDVFGRAPAGAFAAFAGRFAFIDIGTPESLLLAERVIGSEAGRRSA
jgi:mannose-1-phosphate guanylyltransferase